MIAPIQLKSIRRIYYMGNFFVFLMLTLALTVPILPNLKNEYEKKVEQLYEGIVEQEKYYIKAVVLEKISDIEQLIQGGQKEFLTLAEWRSQAIALILESRYESEEALLDAAALDDSLWEFPMGEMAVILMDSRTGKKIGELSGAPMGNAVREENSVSAFSRVFTHIDVVVFFPQDQFDRILRNRAAAFIRNTELPDGGYIWVNHVLDYKGGQDYAVHLVHPNLPEREGEYISSDVPNFAGDYLYRKELESINDTGEVFLKYQYKKRDSEEISMRLSYSRLYKDFDWIIATSVSLDDIYSLVKKEQGIMRDSFYKEIRFIFGLIFIIMILLILVLISFERRISNLLLIHTKELQDKNRELFNEKSKVEDAYKKIEEVAYFDPLTNVWNRRAMYDRLSEEASRSVRTGESFCLIMADVDRFKQINDSYGHNAGDYILKELAALLRRNLRNEDSISRWGGEEFLIFINAATLKEGAFIAEKLRGRIEKQIFNFEDAGLNITMTFGVSEFSQNGNLDLIINSADNKLYYGKKMGRNRVIHEIPGTPETNPEGDAL